MLTPTVIGNVLNKYLNAPTLMKAGVLCLPDFNISAAKAEKVQGVFNIQIKYQLKYQCVILTMTNIPKLLY